MYTCVVGGIRMQPRAAFDDRRYKHRPLRGSACECLDAKLTHRNKSQAQRYAGTTQNASFIDSRQGRHRKISISDRQVKPPCPRGVRPCSNKRIYERGRVADVLCFLVFHRVCQYRSFSSLSLLCSHARMHAIYIQTIPPITTYSVGRLIKRSWIKPGGKHCYCGYCLLLILPATAPHSGPGRRRCFDVVVNGKVASVSSDTLPGVLRTTPDKATCLKGGQKGQPPFVACVCTPRVLCRQRPKHHTPVVHTYIVCSSNSCITASSGCSRLHSCILEQAGAPQTCLAESDEVDTFFHFTAGSTPKLHQLWTTVALIMA